MLLHLLQKKYLPPTSFLLLRQISTSSPIAPSLTLHFLQNSCSLSASQALSVSRKIHLKSTKKPHSILSLLRSHSFTSADISSLLLRIPRILLSDPNKTLSPKLSFFLSLGLSPADLVSLLLSHPSLLLSSLPNRLRPNLSLLLSLLPPSSPRHAVLTYPSSLSADLSSLLPKIHSLTARGISSDFALRILTSHPRSLSASVSHIECVLSVLQNDFSIDPGDPIFPHAYGVLAKLSQPDWTRRMDFMKTLGWTEELIMVAFRKHPYFMTASMEKLGRNMGVFTEEFGWDAEYVARYPVVLSLSYEKRILPRWRVIKILKEEGLFEGEVTARQLMLGKDEFWRRYVAMFQDRAPGVVDAIGGKVD